MGEIKNPWPKGVKKTRQRAAVLSVLEQAEKPLSALSIAQRITGEGESTWLSTVYRSLELFEKTNIVTRISMMERDKALYALNRFRHRHYAVCVGCHRVVEMENCPMEEFVPDLTDREFHVLGHKIEMYGYCKGCGGEDP